MIIGATAEGKKELVGLTDGIRESAQSWKELLLDLKRRGLDDRAAARGRRRGARLLEGARRGLAEDTRATLLGAQNREYPQQAAKEPARQGQARAAGHLDGGDQEGAEAARDAFIEAYGLKYEKAVECLTKDRKALFAFYDFPAEHWKHLRTTNPIESTFATVRHRTIRSRGCLSNKTALAMIFKLAQAAEKSLAPSQRPRPVAESDPRCNVQRRNRGRQIASSNRCRLTSLVTKIRR